MAESDSGTVITKTTDPAIIDLLGEKFTLVTTNGGQVCVNGTTDTTTGNVVKILYVGHLVYHVNKAGLVYLKAQATAPAWLLTTMPALPTPPSVTILPNPTHATVQAQIDSVTLALANIRTNVGTLTP